MNQIQSTLRSRREKFTDVKRAAHVLQPILGIAETVWKRAVDRTLGFMLLGGAALIVALVLTTDLQESDARAALLLIHVFVTMLVIFVGTTEIPRDLATRNVQVFLSKPLSRAGYVCGKFAGLLILAELILVAYVACLGVSLAAKGFFHGADFVHGLARTTLQLGTLCALLVGLSVVLPEMAATILGVAFVILSYVTFILPPAARLLVPEWLQPFTLLVYLALPNSQHYLWTPDAGSASFFFAMLCLYSVSYCICALTAASLWFRRRDLL